MKKILIVLSILLMSSCTTIKSITPLKEGYYLGKIRKDLIFEYTVLLKVNASTVTLEAYVEEKGMVSAYDIFSSKECLPYTMSFRLQQDGDSCLLVNDLNQLSMKVGSGELILQSPLKVKLKYYNALPIELYPSKKKALYDFTWHCPHVILGLQNEFSTQCSYFIRTQMDSNIKRIDESMSYEVYYNFLKERIGEYKRGFDEQKL